MCIVLVVEKSYFCIVERTFLVDTDKERGHSNGIREELEWLIRKCDQLSSGIGFKDTLFLLLTLSL